MKSDKWYYPIANLGLKIAVGTIIFLMIVIPAVLLNLLIKWLENQVGISGFLVLILASIEYTIVVGDGFLFLIFLVKEIFKAGKEP